MKASLFSRFSAAAFLLVTTVGLSAAESSSPPRAPQELKEMAAVEQFLELPDAELDQLLEVIARIRAMSPEQRVALRREVAAYRRLPAPEREQMRQGWGRMHSGMGMGSGWGRMPAEIQEGWREMIRDATPEQHASIQDKLQSLAPDERIAYRRRLVEDYLKQKSSKP